MSEEGDGDRGAVDLPAPGGVAAPREGGGRPAGDGLSLFECVRRGKLAIPPAHRQQKRFFRFLRRASGDERFLDEVRRLRDEIVLDSVREGRGDRGTTLALASPRGGEGTSVLALTLGLALGDCGMRKVAFLDGRLQAERFDVLSRWLELSRNAVSIPKGFSEIAGYCNERYENVYFLRNSIPERSMDFFSDKRLGSFIEDLRGKFDFTVLDLPPLLSEASGLFVLPYVDRLYLVVEAGRTRILEVDRCLEVARDAGCQVAGVVLNKQTAPWWSRFFWREFFY